MMDKAEVLGYGAGTFETALTVAQTNEVLQMIMMALSILSFTITTCYTMYKWYKRATSDDSAGGKEITKEEIEELKEEAKNAKDKWKSL